MKVRQQVAQYPRGIRQDVRRIVRRIICASSGEVSGHYRPEIFGGSYETDGDVVDANDA